MRCCNEADHGTLSLLSLSVIATTPCRSPEAARFLTTARTATCPVRPWTLASRTGRHADSCKPGSPHRPRQRLCYLRFGIHQQRLRQKGRSTAHRGASLRHSDNVYGRVSKLSRRVLLRVGAEQLGLVVGVGFFGREKRFERDLGLLVGEQCSVHVRPVLHGVEHVVRLPSVCNKRIPCDLTYRSGCRWPSGRSARLGQRCLAVHHARAVVPARSGTLDSGCAHSERSSARRPGGRRRGRGRLDRAGHQSGCTCSRPGRTSQEESETLARPWSPGLAVWPSPLSLLPSSFLSLPRVPPVVEERLSLVPLDQLLSIIIQHCIGTRSTMDSLHLLRTTLPPGLGLPFSARAIAKDR